MNAGTHYLYIYRDGLALYLVVHVAFAIATFVKLCCNCLGFLAGKAGFPVAQFLSYGFKQVQVILQVCRNESGWKQWFDNDAPEESLIPDGYEISLDTFRKLLLVRSGRQQSLIFFSR